MAKTIIRCPHYKGQKLSIMEEMAKDRVFNIIDNKLYYSSDEMERPTGKITICCLDCLQDEDLDPAWKATKDEAKVAVDMILEYRSSDVSEYMNE